MEKVVALTKRRGFISPRVREVSPSSAKRERVGERVEKE
jgi:hypothetical protein